MHKDQIKILAADDDPDILEILDIVLKREGYQVVLAKNGEEAIRFASPDIDLFILDIAMPVKDGFFACREIRSKSMAPILFLTARTQETDKAAGFSSGADDYLAKPFSNAELLLRVNALLRRCYIYRHPGRGSQVGVYELGRLTLNTNTKTVSLNQEPILLTPTEYGILELMIQYSGKVFSVQELYESVWNEPYSYVENNTIVVHISNLRKKIEVDPKTPEYIKSMWGKGYYVEQRIQAL
ncbi:response regulator transcription factor [Diplocloster modestus]|uniref:Stage 0 sporulation protein A homolog n=1 Tax=Diplocloster modestus TaxID=2850322 RepID=A0ABS6KA86_9FIRM|nr:response regulator transcription factor [Diplocloster modestus]MBU9727433.1 response regulator transcription factor [Diplocloster modestus]